MKRLVIVAHGDNVRLHQDALEAAVNAVEEVNKAPVYRAWIEESKDHRKLRHTQAYMTSVPCPKCGGNGRGLDRQRVWENPSIVICDHCLGMGFVLISAKAVLRIRGIHERHMAAWNIPLNEDHTAEVVHRIVCWARGLEPAPALHSHEHEEMGMCIECDAAAVLHRFATDYCY